ncbi:TPA: HipA N-terminal domain-containing protein [Burkholderia vietnamiensis]|nr:HipA N-terminal domain-containing protein [Burkholderia vietnamiensis]
MQKPAQRGRCSSIWATRDWKWANCNFPDRGQKEVSAFRYSLAWLSNPDCFALSPDLPLSTDFQYRTGSEETSTFAGAIADTEPDGWGRRVIDLAHAKRRKADKDAGRDAGSAQLSDLDYLLGVLDSSRIGALRFRNNARLRR